MGIDTLTKILRTFLDQSVLIFCSSATRTVVVVEVVATLLLLYATESSFRASEKQWRIQKIVLGAGAKEVWGAVDTSSH